MRRKIEAKKLKPRTNRSPWPADGLHQTEISGGDNNALKTGNLETIPGTSDTYPSLEG